jgi:hypothetical protein
MNSLIDRVLSVESEASAIIEKARADARELEKRSNIDIDVIHNEAAVQVEKKIAAFRDEATRKHEEEVAKQEVNARNALEEVDRISTGVIFKQVEKIVDRFREI